MISNDLDEKYYELQDVLSSIRNLKEECKDKDVLNILENCEEQLQNEFDNIKDSVEEMWDRENKEQEREYERSVL